MTRSEAGRLDILAFDGAGLARRSADAHHDADIDDAILTALAWNPVGVGPADIMPLLTIAHQWIDIPATHYQDEIAPPQRSPDQRRVPPMPETPVTETDADAALRQRYGADMAVAADVARTLREGGISLAWQPVVGRNLNDVLYYEGLVRIVRKGGAIGMPSEIVPALERIGLIRQLDRHVVLATIDRLRRHPDLWLGCNISGQSALSDAWWTRIFAELAQSPAIAQRLTVEITESAAFPSLAQAQELVGRLRAFGCRIAIDDFGSDHALAGDVSALAPDIIKIDGSYVRRAGDDPDGKHYPALVRLIELARQSAPYVVVEGVESEPTLATARTAGARWFQGFQIGGPQFTTPSGETLGGSARRTFNSFMNAM